MAAGIPLGRMAVVVLLGGVFAASAGAQFYGSPDLTAPEGYASSPPVPGLRSYGESSVPPVGGLRAYGDSDYVPPVPGQLTYGYPYWPEDFYGFPAYGANPYAPAPDTFSYPMPPASYGAGLSPYNSGPTGYPPDLFSYFPFSRSYRPPPGYKRGFYRVLPLGVYIAVEIHGPTRVRDIVPGVPELGG